MSDSDKKKKISPEKLQQLQKLQQMMMQQQNSLALQGKGKTGKLTPRGIFIAILQNMQKGVKFIDQFIDFIIKKDSDKTNDVIKSARAPIKFGVFILVFFVFVGITWSATAPLDSAAVAIGTVISNTNKKNINHPEGGIVRKIYVKLGDKVKKGDSLLAFDDRRIKSEYENYLNQYRSYLASESRLLAEINKDEEVNYPDFLMNNQSLPEVSKIIETQNNLFHSKKKLHIAEKDSLKQQIEQSKKQIEGYEFKKVATNKTLEVVRDRLKANRQLESKGYAHKASRLELEAKEANAVSELAMIDTEISKNEQGIIKTEIDLINLDSKNSTNTLTELRDTQIRLAESRERFFAYEDSLKRVVIKSPVDGVINNLNFHTIGSSIPPSQSIMEISPSDDKLIIEAKIPPKNIDSIVVGLNSKIRFSAFKSRTTPLFSGTVKSLSPDIIMPHGQVADPRLMSGYYLARIELDMDEFEKLATPRNLKLQPGMQAEVQIITGTRTLLQYLLSPVMDAMFKGFKEK